MMDDEIELSVTGRTRREQILAQALAEARARRRGRHLRRSAVAAGIILLTISSVIMMNRKERPAPAVAPLIVRAPVPSERPEPISITYIQTDPTIVDRLSIKPAPPTWTTISDDELLEALAHAGQPAGIIYHEGRAILLPR